MRFERSSWLVALVLLGACRPNFNLRSGHYRVSSDCPGAPGPAVLAMTAIAGKRDKNDEAVTPYRYRMEGLSAYGLPSDEFVGGLNTSSLTAEDDARVCRGRTFDQGDDGTIFLCRDKESGAECAVSLAPA